MIIQKHLPLVFSYLDGGFGEPSRLQCFNRVISFLLEKSSDRLLAYLRNTPEVVTKIVNNLARPQLLELIIKILSWEDTMSKVSANIAWSNSVNLGKIVADFLTSSPEANLPSVTRLITEICNWFPASSSPVRNFLSSNEGNIFKALPSLLLTPTTSYTAVKKLLNKLLLPTILKTVDDTDFYSSVIESLRGGVAVLGSMLTNKSIRLAFAGATLFQSLAKNRLFALIDDQCEAFVDLLFVRKWSNILHQIVLDTLLNASGLTEEAFFIALFQKTTLIPRSIAVLKSSEITGNRGHLLRIVNIFATTSFEGVQTYLLENEEWKAFLPILQVLNDANLNFREAEKRRKKEAASQGMPF